MGRKMFRKIGIIGLVAVLLIVAIGWFNRALIVQYIALSRAKANRIEAGPTRTVQWDQGPAKPAAPLGDRPPQYCVHPAR